MSIQPTKSVKIPVFNEPVNVEKKFSVLKSEKQIPQNSILREEKDLVLNENEIKEDTKIEPVIIPAFVQVGFLGISSNFWFVILILVGLIVAIILLFSFRRWWNQRIEAKREAHRAKIRQEEGKTLVQPPPYNKSTNSNSVTTPSDLKSEDKSEEIKPGYVYPKQNNPKQVSFAETEEKTDIRPIIPKIEVIIQENPPSRKEIQAEEMKKTVFENLIRRDVEMIVSEIQKENKIQSEIMGKDIEDSKLPPSIVEEILEDQNPDLDSIIDIVSKTIEANPPHASRFEDNTTNKSNEEDSSSTFQENIAQVD